MALRHGYLDSSVRLPWPDAESSKRLKELEDLNVDVFLAHHSLSYFSVAVMKHHEQKATWGGQGFFQLTYPEHSPP